MADINAIAEQIQGLTLLEASQLVKLLEEKLGVHLSPLDSDYDHRKCDDRLTAA